MYIATFFLISSTPCVMTNLPGMAQSHDVVKSLYVTDATEEVGLCRTVELLGFYTPKKTIK